jgi:ADP-heptose:LPS heptosyltransferase
MPRGSAVERGPAEVRASPWRGDDDPERVLAVRLHALGDTVITLPYLNALRRRLPRAKIDLLTRHEVAGIPRSLVLFDEVHEIGGGRDQRRIWLSALSLLPRLRRRRYDVVFDLQRNRLSRVVRHALRPAAWSEFDRTSPRLAGERTRTTIEAVGLGQLDVWADLEPRQPELGMDRLRAAGWNGVDDLVVLNPAGLTPARHWPTRAWGDFAERWAAGSPRPARFVLLGLPSLEPRARVLVERLGERALDLVGRTSAAEAFCIVRRAALVLSEDSGLLHMAWVAGVPTFGLFGASSSVWARPHGSRSAYVATCRRGHGACVQGTCLEGPPNCLERLSADEVVGRARALVERQPSPPSALHVGGHLFAPPLDG